ADIQAEAVEAAADAIRGLRVEHDPQPVAGDLATVDACAEVVARAVETGGCLNAVVNCAGMGGIVGTVESHPGEVWPRVLDTNPGSVFGVCRAAVPHLRAAGGGAIVNFASAAAYRGSAAVPSHVYAASKGGVIAITRVMAASYGRDRIRVNAIVPGLV